MTDTDSGRFEWPRSLAGKMIAEANKEVLAQTGRILAPMTIGWWAYL